MKKITISNENIDKKFNLELWTDEEASKSLESLISLENVKEICGEYQNALDGTIEKFVVANGKVYSIEASTLDQHNFKTKDFSKFNIGCLVMFDTSFRKLGFTTVNSQNPYFMKYVKELVSILNEGQTHKRIKLLIKSSKIDKIGYPCSLYKWDITNASPSQNRAGRIIYTVLEEFGLILFCDIYAKNQKIDLSIKDEENIFVNIEEYLIRCRYMSKDWRKR